MIRIYLDWSVISCLKKDEYEELLEFIKSHKEKLLFPYTPAHFNDLMRSYTPENDLFFKDLEQLEWLSGHHLLELVNDDWSISVKSPREYFEELKTDKPLSPIEMIQKLQLDAENDDFGMWNFGKLIKMISEKKPSGITITDENWELLNILFPGIHKNSSQWDLMKAVVPFATKLESEKEFYKDFRKTINEQGLKLKTDSGSWKPEEVFKNIDAFFKKMGTNMTFKRYVEMTVSSSKGDQATKYDYFTNAYLMLDLIGFKQEKLPKDTNNLQNIRTDVDHAFYASTCDYFVVMDKALTIKTKVLYSEFKIEAKVIAPGNLIKVLTERFHNQNSIGTFINDSLGMLIEENLTEEYITSFEPDIEVDTCIYKLPVFYFDFFTYVNVLKYPEQNTLVLEFFRPYSTHYFFSYYTEIQWLTDRILNFFGYQYESQLEEKKNNFIYNTKEQSFLWKFGFGVVQLLRDPENDEPKLIYVVKKDPDNGNL